MGWNLSGTERVCIDKLFHYDLEVDLSCHLFPSSSNETFKLNARHLNDLRRLYEKQSCLNLNHSEKILDIFRFCIRRNPVLSKYLDKNLEGFDNSQSNPMETALTGSSASIAPQPSYALMEMDTQSRLAWLVSKEVAVSEFEKLWMG